MIGEPAIYSTVAICEECGYAIDITKQSIAGWAQSLEIGTAFDGKLRYPIHRGDVCDICFAKSKAGEK